MCKLEIAENNLPEVKMWNGQRVVTFDDITSVHECERKRLTKHFERKRKHFIKDEDYFEISRKDLRDMVSPNSSLTRREQEIPYSSIGRG